MKKTKLDIQSNCETHIFRIADNIERLLNNKGISLNKLTTSAEIEGVTANEKQLFANLIYNFMKKVNAYKTSEDNDKSIPYIAYSTIVTLADYLNVPVNELISEHKESMLCIPLYEMNETKTLTISYNIFNNIEDKDKIFAVKIIDSTMKPLININDIVFAVEEEKYNIDGLYVIKTDRGYYPKRIIFHKNTADIISDNTYYHPVSYTIQQNNELYSEQLKESIFIVGKVISLMNNSINFL